MRTPALLLAVLLELLGARNASGAECRIFAARARLAHVTVAAGATTIPLRLDDVPADVVLSTGPLTTIRVKAPLEFNATVPSGELAIRAKKPVELAGGRIRIGRGMGLVQVGIDGDRARVSLERMLGIEVRQPLELPCSQLELDARRWFVSPTAVAPARARGKGIGAGFVPVFVQPEATDPLEVRFPGPFEVAGRRPGWVLIQARWEDGSRLRGWTLERNVLPPPEPLGGRGGGGRGELDRCYQTHEPLTVERKMRKGAPIAASPGGEIWAHAARAIRVSVSAEGQDGWLSISKLAGLREIPCSNHLWVSERDVSP